MSFFSVIFSNVIGFDGVIFIVAIVNAFILVFARNRVNSLYDALHPRVYVPTRRDTSETLNNKVRALDEENLVKMRDSSVRFYTLFVTITSLFPLFGILGTVISLLEMVSDLSGMQQNFFAALTSTFWGLVFAIGFKSFDGLLLSSRAEDNEKNVALFLDRLRPEGKAEKP